MRYTIPFFTEIMKGKPNLSTYYVAKGILEEAARREDIGMTVFQPEGKGYLEGPDYWDVQAPNIEFHGYTPDPLTTPTLGYANHSLSSFSKRTDYLAILNQKITASPMIQKVLSKPFAGFHPAVVNFGVVGDFNETHVTMHPSTKFEMLSSYAFFWNIFVSEGHMKRTKKEMMKVFKPSVVQEAMRRSVFINHGADIERIDSLPVTDVQEDKFVLLYGGRPVTHKRIDLMIETCNYLYVKGYPVQLELFLVTERTHGAEEKIKEYSAYPFVNIHENRPLDEFHSMCRRCDGFIAASTAEAYGISYVEMMSQGARGIFFDRPWVSSIVPPDYPFVVKSVQEAVQALATIMDEHKKDMELRKFMQTNHSKAMHDQLIVTLMRNLSVAIEGKRKPKTLGDLI